MTRFSDIFFLGGLLWISSATATVITVDVLGTDDVFSILGTDDVFSIAAESGIDNVQIGPVSRTEINVHTPIPTLALPPIATIPTTVAIQTEIPPIILEPIPDPSQGRQIVTGAIPDTSDAVIATTPNPPQSNPASAVVDFETNSISNLKPALITTTDKDGSTTVFYSTITEGRAQPHRSNSPSTSTDPLTPDASIISAGGSSFLKNKTAIAIVFTIVGLAIVAIIGAIAFFLYRRAKKTNTDNWENESVSEFAPSAAFTAPSITPWTSSGKYTGSSHYGYDDDIDEMLALPPVRHHERSSPIDGIPGFPTSSSSRPGPALRVNTGSSSNSYQSSGIVYTRKPYDPSTPRISRVPVPPLGPEFVDAVRESGEKSAGPGPGSSIGHGDAASPPGYESGGYAMPPYQGDSKA